MEKYKVGDKVVCPIRPKNPEEKGGPGWNCDMDGLIGKVGTIKEVCKGYEKTRYYVGFDEGWDNWFYLEKWLVPAKESKCSNYTIWTDNIKIVSASDDKTGIIAFARCHPNDSFDLVTGIEIAMDRLIEKIKNRFYTGEVFCAETSKATFSRGYIYHINNGILYNDNGSLYCNDIIDPEDLARDGVVMIPVEGTKN